MVKFMPPKAFDKLMYAIIALSIAFFSFYCLRWLSWSLFDDPNEYVEAKILDVENKKIGKRRRQWLFVLEGGVIKKYQSFLSDSEIVVLKSVDEPVNMKTYLLPVPGEYNVYFIEGKYSKRKYYSGELVRDWFGGLIMLIPIMILAVILRLYFNYTRRRSYDGCK